MSQLTGTVLVTGGTLGLGYQTALQIAQQRPAYQIVVASRNDSASSATAINKATGRNNAVWLPLDLASFANIRAFVEDYSKRDFPPIKALLLNAGLQFFADINYTKDGFESTFGVNHVGHALLFYLMRPQLAPDARIVITSSGVHDPAQKIRMPDPVYNTAEKLAHPTGEAQKKDGRQHYTNSKLANVLWTYALHRHLQTGAGGKKWTVTAFNPGLMPGTGLIRDAAPLVQFVWFHILPHLLWLLRRLLTANIKTVEESGFALARLAVSDDVEGKSGVYFDGLREIKSSVDSYKTEKQDDLWEWTVKTVAKDEAERRSFEQV